MASPSSTAVYTVYTGICYVQPPNYLGAGITATGTIIYEGRSSLATFTVISAVSAAATNQPVAVSAIFPANTVNYANLNAIITFWTPRTPGQTTDWADAPPQTTALTSVSVHSVAAAIKSDSATSSARAASTSTGQFAQTSQATLTSSTPVSATPASTIVNSKKAEYGTGVVAGAAVGCLFGGILLSALLFFLWMRRRGSSKATPKATEKGLPLLEGHGEAIYVAGNDRQGWEKHLPQADSDSTIKNMTSRTLDQIAMHVENFYVSKENTMMTTEHQFELETIECSELSQAISTMLLRSRRTEDLIKHYISSYIVSMISFGSSEAKGMFLPKSYRKQWHHQPQSAQAVAQAYSRWRVLTAYLRENGGDERVYLTERDAVIETAARHVCKAFEPWAKAEESIRLQNMVGIMKRASELGMQLFSQPAVFEWQWQPTTSGRSDAAPGAPTQIAILPGLCKVTDQIAQPLPKPLRLVEPLLVSLKDL